MAMMREVSWRYLRCWVTTAWLGSLLTCGREPPRVPLVREIGGSNALSQPQGNATPSANGLGMPGSPAFLAAGDVQLLLADRGGNLQWWDWPKPRGMLIKAHDDGGPVAGTTWFATSGGWDPTIKRWEPGAEQPRFTVRPFDGRVTALCIQADDLLVAGANRAASQGDAKSKDRAALSAGTVVRVDAQGKVTPFALTAVGLIEQLLCGIDWILAVDQGTRSAVLVVRGGRQRQILLAGGPATAAASRGGDAVVADGAGLWVVDPVMGAISPLAGHANIRILSLVALGNHVFGATSEGVIHWPGGERITHDGQQPAALARQGQHLLILWEDGVLEQRSSDGRPKFTETIPRKP
jgi:hypothetical protein